MDPNTLSEKYNRIADWWNQKHLESSYGVKPIERAIQYCTNRNNALDVGCGAGGRVIRKLLENGFKVTGLDVSSRMIEIAKLNHPDTDFILDDICNWNSDNKFDLIVAWDSIFHVEMKHQKEVVQKLLNLLNENGIIVYSFGDTTGDHLDLSFRNLENGQFGNLDKDLFGYGSIGINGNLSTIIDNNAKCIHLELDQHPSPHAYLIAKKEPTKKTDA